MHEVDEIGPEGRIEKHDGAGFLDEARAEHQPVLLIRELQRQRAVAGNHLEGGLEEFGEGIADHVGEVTEQPQAEGDVGHHLDRLIAELVDDADGDARDQQHRIDQDHPGEPLPAVELVRCKRIGQQRGNEAGRDDDGQGPGVAIGADHGGHGVEDAIQRVVVAVAVDFVHDRCSRFQRPGSGVL